MPRLDRLSAAQRNRILTRPVEINETTPWTPFEKALPDSILALVTTAGLHLRNDEPFGRDDPSYRVIPSEVRESDLLQSSSSIGFDRSLRMRDINVVFPIDRLRTLLQDRAIGGLAPSFYSLVGAQKSPDRIRLETGPALVKRLRQEGVDVVVLTPT